MTAKEAKEYLELMRIVDGDSPLGSEALDLAEAALDRQEPSEPFEVEIPNSFGDKILVCRECGEYIPWYANYCSKCGQAIKKGEEDEHQ